MTIILNLALRFGGNGFYLHHIHFASGAAARLQQIKENTAWGSIDNEIYCRIFAAHQASPCNRAAYHHTPHPRPPTSPRPHRFASPQTARPRPAASVPSSSFPVTNGIDKRGRPIMRHSGKSVCNISMIPGVPMSLPPRLLLLRRRPRPSCSPTSTLNIPQSVFSNLGVPLSAEKTEGPLHIPRVSWDSRSTPTNSTLHSP